MLNLKDRIENFKKDTINHIITCESLAEYYKEEKRYQLHWKYVGKVEGLESSLGKMLSVSIVQVWEMVAEEKLRRKLKENNHNTEQEVEEIVERNFSSKQTIKKEGDLK